MNQHVSKETIELLRKKIKQSTKSMAESLPDFYSEAIKIPFRYTAANIELLERKAMDKLSSKIIEGHASHRKDSTKQATHDWEGGDSVEALVADNWLPARVVRSMGDTVYVKFDTSDFAAEQRLEGEVMPVNAEKLRCPDMTLKKGVSLEVRVGKEWFPGSVMDDTNAKFMEVEYKVKGRMCTKKIIRECRKGATPKIRLPGSSGRSNIADVASRDWRVVERLNRKVRS